MTTLEAISRLADAIRYLAEGDYRAARAVIEQVAAEWEVQQ
jgi:DNA polymerase III delta prime subunit